MSIGFIGAGRIALALSRGFVKANLLKPSSILASAPRGMPSQIMEFKNFGANVCFNNREVVENSKVIFITTKASVVPSILTDISPVVTKENLFVSIAAGVTINAMERCLPVDSRVIRVMTNTPCLVNEGATAFAVGSNASPEDSKTALNLLSSVGHTLQCDESLLDAVCGLSGSGPAYVYIFIESMVDGGVRMGLPRELALRLATQTVYGSAKMVAETGEHTSQLKDNVCSPGGSTIYALHGLDVAGFRGMVMDAVQNATIRTSQLSEMANQGILQQQAPPRVVENGTPDFNKRFLGKD